MRKNNLPEQAKLATLTPVHLLGVKYLIGNERTLNQLIFEHLEKSSEQAMFAAHINLHGLALCRKNEDMKAYVSCSDFHWIDGMPVVYILRALKYNIMPSWRLTFLDWQHSFFKLANEKGLRIFLLGANQKNIEKATQRLRKSYPKITFAFHHGYIFSHVDTQRVVRLENKFKPDILLLGMGMPLQESWALKNKTKLASKVILPLGGYFDYIAADTLTPPRYLGRYGLEWLARLLAAPRKLSYRYLVEPIPVFIALCKELFAQRRND